MAPHGNHAPAWLFAFVDLAFLLLIAMTQLGGDGSRRALDLGEVIVPRVRGDAATELPTGSPRRWQLRVHPPGTDGSSPFELTRPGDPAVEPPARLDPEELRGRLAELRASREAKPLLAPHRDSRSQDLLDAAAWIEELWPTRRRATVAPILARR